MLITLRHITSTTPSSSYVCKLFAQAQKKASIKIDASLTGKGWAHQGMILGPPDYYFRLIFNIVLHNPIKLTQQFRRKLTHHFPGKDIHKPTDHISPVTA